MYLKADETFIKSHWSFELKTTEVLLRTPVVYQDLKILIYVIGLSNLHKLFPNPISEMRFEQFYDAVTEFVNAQW